MKKLVNAASKVRYTKAVEIYSRTGSKVTGNGVRSGAATAPALAARAKAQADRLEQSKSAPAAPAPASGGALAAVAKGIATAIGWEQSLTAPIDKIPFPGLPALCILDLDVGLPHAHNHPPNITPPNPVPIPLPSTGPLIPIPILSGADRTKHGGRSAARCGDMGLGVWCGGYVPMYEIFLGSASVWIEGARAARLGIDITKHCIFTSPKPSDPPIGPMVGTTVGAGCGTVMIGGAPLPSLFSLAVAQIMKGVVKVGGAVFRKVTANAKVDKMIAKGHIVVHGSAKYADDVMKDLYKLAATRSGRDALNRIGKAGAQVEIVPLPAGKGPHNAFAQANSWDAMTDMATGAKGAGSGSVVSHTPENWANHGPPGASHPHPGTSSDAMLHHELHHAANNAEGGGKMMGTETADNWDKRWANHEEYGTTHADNGYRGETGLPPRTNYGALP
ncbi:MAG: hypothetical protein K0V04_21355 [Deltaproteobacteria bacterium]|nr:hypothetical protein [Deltaproteobacteria bacterium]